jgi:hypothetical protein
MKEKFRFLKQEDRKTILLFCDDLRSHSGIAHMAREMVTNTAHHFNWFSVGARVNNPDKGKVFDLSKDINKQTGLDDSNVKIFANEGYGDNTLLRSLVRQLNPDAIMLFTDPRYWTWAFQAEREIRSKIPLFYLNIWDNYPAPLYNKAYYKSCDLLMAISKQTENINKIVLGEDAKSKIIKYVPHGVNDKIFFPIDKDNYEGFDRFSQFKKDLFKGREFEFITLWNSRNIGRKQPGDVLLSFKYFCDQLPKEEADKCALVVHSNPIDNNGTDLIAINKQILGNKYNVYFSAEPLNPEQMNLLYNVSDVVMLISSNEGWGLSITEAVLSGRMVIGNVTGGIQDQFRFEDKEGNWIDFDENFPTNHNGVVKKCGVWAEPVFSRGRKLMGSPPTPYIFDDICDSRDISKSLLKVYKLSPKKRKERGLKGRKWMQSEEASMTSRLMGNKVIEACDEAFDNFVPRGKYELFKVDDVEQEFISHNLD